MIRTKRNVVIASFFLGLFLSATAYAACNQQLAIACRTEYRACNLATGGDPDGACENAYNQCLLSAGCPIP